MTTWAMQILFTGGWVACDAATAADALDEGLNVMLTDEDWLLNERWRTR